ncbi:uncharacterized protein LOC126821734 [Patella vulgata]|uniref:uncharacterized protein LOC126821734 n=1 Tax=Patella vulgata TaxID=6465 RepID=UPI00217FFEDF|nr:uncharacterized protein LOC126821734 [Patella vulgata]
MKTKVQEETKPVCAIYQEEVSALRSDRDSGEMIREIPTFYSCCASLYRARAKILPALPQTRNDIQLPDSYTKTTSGDDFLLHAAADNRFLVFSTQENLYHLANADTIYCDGTFSMSPTLFTQIYTIHAFVHNKMFPLVYALLPDKKEATYVEFLRCVRDKTLALVNVNLNPGHVFTDFEVSMQNAVRTVLPRSELKGCFFHFGQCIWRNAQKYGLQADFSRVPEINKIVKQAAALPLIPIQQVEDVWLHALDDAPLQDARVLQFADYVTEFWVEGQHGRMMWNHFHTEGPRTTNHVEGWHSKITSIIATPHPNIFKLVAFFKNE